MRLWFWDPCPFRQGSFHYNGVAWVCANLYFVDLLLSNAFSCSDKAAKDIYLVKPLNLVHSGLLIYVMGFSEMQKLEYWHWVRHEHNKMYLSAEKKLNVASICSFRERQFSRSGFVGQSCKYTGTTSSTWCIREGTKQSRGTKSKWKQYIYKIPQNDPSLFPHPVHDGCPPLHGDALEGGEHGQHDVVEAGDPLVRTRPLLQADRLVVPLTQTM